MHKDSAQIRKMLLDAWNRHLASVTPASRPDELSGSSPPSVFVGAHGYPKVGIGPLVPAVHGDTSLLDAPERWGSMSLADIVDYRLKLVRGVRSVRADRPEGKFVESLQEMAMSLRPADTELAFTHNLVQQQSPDGQTTPFGSVGHIRSASFSNQSPHRSLEKAYEADDMDARQAVISLYEAGVDVTRIQKCLSVGMFGTKRKLVPTKWSITAVDSVISRHLCMQIMDAPRLDSWRIYSSSRLGNVYSVILFPHTWRYEMVEAWQANGGVMGFGSDSETHAGMNHTPAIAGAYFAARLGVCEYLSQIGACAGVLVLREIRPEYSIPVGVWQVREGVREAMRGQYRTVSGMDEALKEAASHTSVSAGEWMSYGSTIQALKQKTLAEFS